MSHSKKTSEFDEKTYLEIRNNIYSFLKEKSYVYDKIGNEILDIAPQEHSSVNMFFTQSNIRTLDIDPKSVADFVLDITNENSDVLKDSIFDIIICIEVLEHTLNPFDAIREIYRLLKKGGVVLISVPFNFRIHGPLPDCWRFTEHGIKELLKEFDILELKSLETIDRFLMPKHYTVVAKKKYD